MYSRVYVEITNACNMHCSFCHGHSRPAGRMDEKMFAHILAQLADQTKYIYYHLMGEPLLHPQLPLFLQMAKQAGFLSIITTNGTLLARRQQELIDAKPHKFNISVHSFEGTDMTAFENYVNEIATFADAANEAGIIVNFRLWNKGFDGGRNEKILALLRQRLPGQWAENTRGYRIREKLYLEWGDRFGWPDKDAPIQGESVFCHGMRDHFGILCDGTVVPCCLDSDGVINLGNVLQQNISEILDTPRAKAIVQGFDRRMAAEELCRRCPYAQRFS